MTKASETFEASFLEATRRFLPVMPPDCSIGGTQTAIVDEDIEQDVSKIHDEIG